MEKNLLIIRTIFEDKQTLGVGYVVSERPMPHFEFKTLELPWLDNTKYVSCIPAGTYKCVKRNTPKYKDHFHVLDVPNRSHILIHHGNYYTDILGCILPGDAYRDLNKDGYLDVLNSKLTMDRLNTLLPNEFTLTIR